MGLPTTSTNRREPVHTGNVARGVPISMTDIITVYFLTNILQCIFIQHKFAITHHHVKHPELVNLAGFPLDGIYNTLLARNIMTGR